MTPIIEIKNIGKRYNITGKARGYVVLREILMEYLEHPIISLEKIIRKILGTNRDEIFWALKDINFSVNQGEAIGIIGANGAGKSTLLKILSRITPPTEGEIRIHGRVASLLEVGTGFHPELSGRENIFLNGAILGMTKKEISAKFDQIVEFSGIEQFLDTPVKRYSSGMYVRLAFSVAAHMEPDILLVDEVLAVGDAEFQKKCLGKMDEVTRTGGRTIIFVSHNMDAISRLCSKVILLKGGKIVAYGKTDDVIGKYLSAGHIATSHQQFPLIDKEVTINSFEITQNGVVAHTLKGEEAFNIAINFSIASQLRAFRVGVYLKNITGTVISRAFIQDYDETLEEILPGKYTSELKIPAHLLMHGEYRIELKIFSLGIKAYFDQKEIEKSVTIHSPKEYNEVRSKNTDVRGYFHIPSKWQIKKD